MVHPSFVATHHTTLRREYPPQTSRVISSDIYLFSIGLTALLFVDTGAIRSLSSPPLTTAFLTRMVLAQRVPSLFTAAQIFGLLTKCQGKHSGRGWGQEKKMPYGIIQSILSFFSGSKPWRKGGSGLPLPLILAVGREQDCAPIFGRQRCPRSKSAACAGLFGRRDCPAR